MRKGSKAGKLSHERPQKQGIRRSSWHDALQMEIPILCYLYGLVRRLFRWSRVNQLPSQSKESAHYQEWSNETELKAIVIYLCAGQSPPWWGNRWYRQGLTAQNSEIVGNDFQLGWPDDIQAIREGVDAQFLQRRNALGTLLSFISTASHWSVSTTSYHQDKHLKANEYIKNIGK